AVGEVLTQVVADLDAGFAQLPLEEIGDDRQAAAARRAGPRRALDAADVGQVPVGDGAADRALADVVAGADGGGRSERLDTEGRCVAVGVGRNDQLFGV